MTDVKDVLAELEWLAANPHFAERPATLREFLGPGYLDIWDGVRPRIRDELQEIFGDDVDGHRLVKWPYAMVTGAIGIGKTTIASIVLPYMVHWTLCLKDPQGFFGLLPGSRIAFMQMSVSEDQAKEVVFGDIKARIENAKWFKRFPYDPKWQNQLRFDKNIWVLPGGSKETQFEGYNILGGILDEADSHTVNKEGKDYADIGFETIANRVQSRFETGDDSNIGFVLVIGQMKSGSGFAARKYAEFQRRDDAHAVSLTIWESRGDDFYRCKREGPHDDNPTLDPGEPCGQVHKFAFDTKRKRVVSNQMASLLGDADNILWIPKAYLRTFTIAPEKALKDLAGMPPAVGDAFISLEDKIDDARTRWILARPELASDAQLERVTALSLQELAEISPVTPEGKFQPWFRGSDSLKRVIHLDIAYSSEGDSFGWAMGHVRGVIEVEDEMKPYIVIDAVGRIRAPAGGEIFLADVRRQVPYHLRDDLRFKVVKVTTDGFQCLTGETLVPLLDGRTLSMAELAERYPQGGFWTYSFDGERIAPGFCTKAWKTGKRRVIGVALDNGEIVRCTEDHPFMLRDGTYRQARDLRNGDALMPLERDVTGPDSTYGLCGYERVRQPYMNSRDPRARARGRWQFTHRMVAGDVPAEHVVHHVDFDKRNNAPENLRVMTLDDHLELHREHGANNFRQLWQDPGFRAKTAAAVSAANSAAVGEAARRYRHDVSVESLMEYRHLPRAEVTRVTGWSQDMIYARVRAAGYSGWADFRASAGVNHRVSAVLDIGEEEDVYDLSIAEHHNFGLAAGIFVHNSTEMRQQLYKRRFDVEKVSVDTDLLPYYDLRDALYEDRIEIPPYVTMMRPGDTELVEITVKELRELVDAGKKIDHPPNGSKDVADAIAGVTFTLAGDRSFRRSVASLDLHRQQREQRAVGGISHPAFRGDGGMRAPLPPRWRA